MTVNNLLPERINTGRQRQMADMAVAIRGITLEEAYPVSVNDIQMSWGDEGYGKMQIEMNYRYSIEHNRNFGSSDLFTMDKNNRMKK